MLAMSQVTTGKNIQINKEIGNKEVKAVPETE